MKKKNKKMKFDPVFTIEINFMFEKEKIQKSFFSFF